MKAERSCGEKRCSCFSAPCANLGIRRRSARRALAKAEATWVSCRGLATETRLLKAKDRRAKTGATGALTTARFSANPAMSLVEMSPKRSESWTPKDCKAAGSGFCDTCAKAPRTRMQSLPSMCSTWAMAKETAASRSTLFSAPGWASSRPRVLTGNRGSPALGVACPSARPTSDAHRSSFGQRLWRKELLHMAEIWWAQLCN